VPVAVETLGALGDEAIAILQDIGQRIAAVIGEPKSHQFLMQQLSVTVRQCNKATLPAFLGLSRQILDMTIFFYD
jgi:hypothetical protein